MPKNPVFSRVRTGARARGTVYFVYFRRWSVRMLKKISIGAGILLAALALVFLFLRVPDTDAAAMRAKYATAASHFVEVEPGLSVHVRDEGNPDGPALLLIHGSSASLQTWEPWVREFGGAYRILSYDQPGHGLTGPHPRRCYDADCMVAVAHAVAADAGLRNFVIGGNSMGGWVALHYAMQHPDDLAGMILVDAAGVAVDTDTADRRTPIGFRIAAMPGINRLASAITPRSMIETSLKQTVADPASVTDADVDRYWDLLRYPGNRQATLDRFSREREPGADAATLATIDVPTLVIWGRRDGLIPVAAATAFDDGLPDSRLVIYDDIGHIPQEEAAARSAADVRSFLQEIYP